MWHTFTIVELLLVSVDFFLFAENTSGMISLTRMTFLIIANFVQISTVNTSTEVF